MDDMPRPVLVADDQPDVIAAIRLLLRSAGFDTLGASSVDEVRAQLAAREYDAVVMTSTMHATRRRASKASI